MFEKLSLFGKRSSGETISFEPPPRDRFLPTSAPISPYAAAWKQFDRLQKRSKSGGGLRWVRGAADLLFLGGAAFTAGIWRSHKAYALAAWLAILALAALAHFAAQKKFENWRCPRCNSVWPGSKTEKASACNVCGLRLHQLYP